MGSETRRAPHAGDGIVEPDLGDLRRIGEVAERAGLSLRTVRYYEEMGLVAPERRTDRGFRLYADEQIERLRRIKPMKALGFTVPEMRELLDARDALRRSDADAAQRSGARERLSAFALGAAERCDYARRQLENADELVAQLRRESRPQSAAPR